jgi:hypothetical protein
MGVLDDAIREHLDLKRRRGADPAEVEQAEREALGPVRRGPDSGAADADSQEGLPYDDQAEEDREEPADGDEEHWADSLEDSGSPEPLPSAEPPTIRRPATHYADPVPEDEEPPPPPSKAIDADLTEDAMVPEGSAGGPAPHAAPGPPVSTTAGEETVEFSVEDAASREGKEDVLEETPEFLQDTPEHDRLWFEQRPPRDFDFDG